MNFLSNELKHAFNVTNPTLFAYLPLGIVFGVLFTHADFSWYLAPVMSALVYAGAVQFIALSMMINHNDVIAIVLAGLFVAVRNSFYGLSVRDRFKMAPVLVKCFLIFGLVDATYAIFTSQPVNPKGNDIKFCFYTTLFPYLYWVVGTFLGAYFSDVIPEIKGLDFIMTGFFFLIALEYYLVKKSTDAILVPVLVSFFSYLLAPQYYLFISILLCTFYLYLKIKVKTS
jgi:4-azaleucine resistance transporter AzlC